MTRRTLLVALLLAACDDGPAPRPTFTVGRTHACLLDDDGLLRCFGGHDLPTPVDWSGDPDQRYVVPAVDVGETVLDVSAGDEHVCAVVVTGEIHCWGDGPGTGTRRPWRERVAINRPVDAPFRRVHAAHASTCGVTEDGTLYCWGTDLRGELGHETAAELVDPATAGPVPLPFAVRELAMGFRQTCAIVDAGAVACWGSEAGLAADARPVDLGGAAVRIHSGGRTFCALLEHGGVRCWGSGPSGSLGHGDDQGVCWPACGEEPCCTDGRPTPAERGDLPLGAPAIDLSVGDDHACAVLEDHTVRCWGRNHIGQLGLGHTETIGDDEPPAQVEVGGPADLVVAGRGDRTCARLQDGTHRCWGNTERWQYIDESACYVWVPNPYAGAICEPATIQEFTCYAGEPCCLGDDEPAAAALPVPL
jgi:alpha-tubulin suppressor-like RCC1 family protein